MTDNEMRIAIAEACGWNMVISPEGSPQGCPPPHNQEGWTYSPKTLPDYPNNLNAMHEAVAKLPDNLTQKYYSALSKVTMRDCMNGKIMLARTEATARQRAEAFLKTIGKWKD